tara:strand:- start:5328 stop:5540 length:213 start_codon:yes stop_codon:yes gene_type:complete
MEDAKYIVFISIKNDQGVLQDHPLRPFQLEVEAEWWLAGYVDAIVNHTGETDINEVKGMFRITEVGKETE